MSHCIGWGEFINPITQDSMNERQLLTNKSSVRIMYCLREELGQHSQNSHYAKGWMVQGSNSGGDMRLFSYKKCPHRLQGPPSLLSSCLGQRSQGMMLTTHFHLVPKLRMKRAKRLHTLYTFMAWAGKNSISYLHLLLLESHLPEHC